MNDSHFLPPGMSPADALDDNSRPLLNTCIAFIVLETVFMALLLVSRQINPNKTGFGMPFLMGLSYAMCMVKITLGILMIKIGGAGHHLWTIANTPTATSLFKLVFALQIVCPLTTSMIKIAVLFLYHRIFAVQSRNYRLSIYITGFIVTSVLLIQVLIPIGNCKPLAVNWARIEGGKCDMDVISLWRYLSVPNVVTDILMLAIPVPALWKLKVSLYTKVGLGLTFLMCGFGVAAAIIRFTAFLHVTDFNDISYASIDPFVWTIIESGIYLIAGVMPTLNPLVTYVFWGGRLERWVSRSLGVSRVYGTPVGFENIEKKESRERWKGRSVFVGSVESRV